MDYSTALESCKIYDYLFVGIKFNKPEIVVPPEQHRRYSTKGTNHNKSQ